MITHEFDKFAARTTDGEVKSGYLLWGVLEHLITMGHHCSVVSGPKAPEADAALLHVSGTIVTQEYLDLAAHYRVAINFGTQDISKRTVSQNLVGRSDAWKGKVVVKANRNCDGRDEMIQNRVAMARGRPLPHPGAKRTGHYRLIESIDAVPEEAWTDPDVVVERFMPETDLDGYAVRTWVFMGGSERCTRRVTRTWLGKASDALRYEPVEVPARLREERERLNFDFGKFDFVINNGEPILLDANRTPGAPRAIEPLLKAGARNLAVGLNELLRS